MATPSVKGGQLFRTGGTTTITDFSDGHLQQVITIISDHSVTLTNSSSLRLSGSIDFNMTTNDTITLVKGTSLAWYEVSRTVI